MAKGQKIKSSYSAKQTPQKGRKVISKKTKVVPKTQPQSGRVSTVVKKQQRMQAEWENLSYNHGFGNHFESEAEKGALPVG